ncbi:succinate dehydrogenase hydrophobic membrane anchor subunit [Gordonia jinhuaensis]|uniref:Succinate dehydrogenase, hydrophobic membrane anchor protein SdhD n=1 Tax=Gordonia jinhuaensis TaxID=1517702 RepID=A0A916SW91_9ACTN|nr:succinate dehydrogenase hydrophobic membrane anchor subunit [Gordonia jinhuaensis]GGB16934.1 putative succinate dehydrogenase, hydrophobic membrane anchor protein SdhD [Gordonia jinhuaensis]
MTTSSTPRIAKTLERERDRPASLDNPRSPRRPKGNNFEKNAWLFMRFSGVALIFLTIGHMFIMLAWDSQGVHRIDASFVAHRWKEPFWQCWDLAMLWLAQLHGGNGVRTVIADYSRNDRTRFWLNVLLALSMILIIGLGTYVLLTFDPSSAS